MCDIASCHKTVYCTPNYIYAKAINIYAFSTNFACFLTLLGRALSSNNLFSIKLYAYVWIGQLLEPFHHITLVVSFVFLLWLAKNWYIYP